MKLIPVSIALVELLLLLASNMVSGKKKGKDRSSSNSRRNRSPTSSMVPSALPSVSMAPSNAPSRPGAISRNSAIAVCRVDPDGFYIPSNDPRFLAEDTVEINTASTTYKEVETAVIDVSAGIQKVTEVTEAAQGIAEFLDASEDVIALLGRAGPLLSMGVAVFGPMLGLKTGTDFDTDRILKRLDDGFNQLNDKLIAVQLQLRRGFLEISSLISDVILDELTSRLDSTGRAYNDYVKAKGTTRFQRYEPRFRAICNEPFQTPEDIFYDLYGYVCDKCEYATRKRADLFGIAVEENGISVNLFFDKFGGFMLRSMVAAMSLHTACLPPIEGSCVDQTQDDAWKDGLSRMEHAFMEAHRRISNKVENLRNWAGNIRSKHIAELVFGDNRSIAGRIKTFLSQQQPDFNIQVIVVDKEQAVDKQNVFRGSCAPESGRCTTRRDKTGHISFDNVRSKGISIRYRLKTLPDLSFDTRKSFKDNFNIQLQKLNTVDSLVALGTPDCPGSSQIADNIIGQTARSIWACAVPQCHQCISVNHIFGDSFYIFRDFNIMPLRNIVGFWHSTDFPDDEVPDDEFQRFVVGESSTRSGAFPFFYAITKTPFHGNGLDEIEWYVVFYN